MCNKKYGIVIRAYDNDNGVQNGIAYLNFFAKYLIVEGKDGPMQMEAELLTKTSRIQNVSEINNWLKDVDKSIQMKKVDKLYQHLHV